MIPTLHLNEPRSSWRKTCYGTSRAAAPYYADRKSMVVIPAMHGFSAREQLRFLRCMDRNRWKPGTERYRSNWAAASFATACRSPLWWAGHVGPDAIFSFLWSNLSEWATAAPVYVVRRRRTRSVRVR